MQRIALLFFALLISHSLFSQVITTVPSLVTENVPVTILFNASLGNAGLKDFTGDVYAHLGVITDKSSSPSDWKYVVADWGVNVPKAKMTRTAPNTYKLDLTPDIRQYFGVAITDKILKLAIVFRSAVPVGNSFAEGKDTAGKDFLVDVFEPGLNVAITKPAGNLIVPPNTDVQFSAAATTVAEMRLFLNAIEIKMVTGTGLVHTLNFSVPGDYWLKVVAAHTAKSVADSIFIHVQDAQVAEPLPAGAKKGISYPDLQSARLVLWAPYKTSVYVIGEFNNWIPSSAFRMKKDGDYFWIEISNMVPGKEYPFQYLVDGTLRIADPYTEKTCDPDNDKYITTSTYPGLIPYPEGRTEGITGILQTGQPSYAWQVNNFVTPAPDTMVVYECHIRDFDERHSYAGVTDHLDYLKELGVNVLELMPVNEFEGNSSWGYNPSFYFAPDKYYGPKNDLKRLVDECHKRGIAIVIDMVLNHSYSQSPFLQLYFDGSKPTSQNPWYNQQSNFTNPDAQWGFDFNHDNPVTRELVDSIGSFWMNEYKIDGFRFDFTKGFSNNIKDSSDPWGSKYDAQRAANLKRMAGEIWHRNPGALVIFEHLADNTEEKELAEYGKGILLWGNLNGPATEASMGYNESGKSDLTWSSYLNRGWTKPSLVAYMESHDEERLVYKNITYGNSAGSYTIKDLPVALSRAALTAALFIPVPGPKMIWQFEEVGYDIPINFNGRTGEKPPHPEYRDHPDREQLFRVFAGLINLKKRYPVFSTADFSHSLGGEIKWIKLNLNGEHVLIIGNFGLTTLNGSPDFQKSGTWYDYFGERSITVEKTSQSVLLAPGEYKLYSTRNFNQGTDNGKNTDQDSIWTFYPNPTSDFINVATDRQIQRIAIFSISGSKIREFNRSGTEGIGKDLFIGDLQAGVYIVQVESGRQVVRRKIIKLSK